MDNKLALQIIKQVATLYVGNLEEHNQIQKAIAHIEAELAPKVAKK